MSNKVVFRLVFCFLFLPCSYSSLSTLVHPSRPHNAFLESCLRLVFRFLPLFLPLPRSYSSLTTFLKVHPSRLRNTFIISGLSFSFFLLFFCQPFQWRVPQGHATGEVKGGAQRSSDSDQQSTSRASVDQYHHEQLPSLGLQVHEMQWAARDA